MLNQQILEVAKASVLSKIQYKKDNFRVSKNHRLGEWFNIS